MRMIAIHAQTERKRLDRSVRCAEKRRPWARKQRLRGLIRPDPAVCATAGAACGRKSLSSARIQAIFTSNDTPLGECRLIQHGASRPGKNARMACKPDFVPGLPPSMTIPLAPPLLTGSSCQPGPSGAKAALPCGARSLFGIAPGGACHAGTVASPPVGSYPTVSPLPADCGRSVLCGAIPGVAPAGRYPAPSPYGVRTFLAARSHAVIQPSARCCI